MKLHDVGAPAFRAPFTASEDGIEGPTPTLLDQLLAELFEAEQHIMALGREHLDAGVIAVRTLWEVRAQGLERRIDKLMHEVVMGL